jgi:RNA polymerase sigma factor (sigma-70 family)
MPSSLYIPLEKTLLTRFREGDRDAFTVIFTTYYKDMVLFAMNFTRQAEIAEEIAQDTFVTLWDERKSITITSSLKSYLLRCIQNSCIDWIRHMKIRQKYLEEVSTTLETFEFNTDNYVLNSELKDLLKRCPQQAFSRNIRSILPEPVQGFEIQGDCNKTESVCPNSGSQNR